MKRQFFTFLFLTLTFGFYAQFDENFCATPDDNTPDPQGKYSYSTDVALYSTDEPVVLNIKFWKINGPNGEFYNSNFEPDHILTAVASLNIEFNQYNIFFKYRGWEEIDSPADVVDIRYECDEWDPVTGECIGYGCVTYPDPDPDGFTKLNRCQLYSFFSFVSNNGNNDSNMINIYFTSWNVAFGGAAQSIGANKIVITSGSLSNPSDIKGLVHEMGHALGLFHTRSYSENVTRDPSDPCFNATTAGDRVVDTAANPGFKLPNCSVNDPACYPYVLPDCTYDPYSPEQDNCGELYKNGINPEDVINVMGNAYICQTTYLTPGQANRMRETIVSDPILTPTITNIASLFEPYKGEYYLAGPFDPNIHTPLFQPGFNYRFMECDGNYPQPADFNDISYPVIENVLLGIQEDETNYANIKHPNHSAIRIQEIAQYDTDANQLDYPRKCYDNTNKAAESGLVTKFNDGVLNTNVTVMPQDSTSINSPQLIQNLQPGLYKIDKVYENGATEQTIILKENN